MALWHAQIILESIVSDDELLLPLIYLKLITDRNCYRFSKEHESILKWIVIANDWGRWFCAISHRALFVVMQGARLSLAAFYIKEIYCVLSGMIQNFRKVEISLFPEIRLRDVRIHVWVVVVASAELYRFPFSTSKEFPRVWTISQSNARTTNIIESHIFAALHWLDSCVGYILVLCFTLCDALLRFKLCIVGATVKIAAIVTWIVLLGIWRHV